MRLTILRMLSTNSLSAFTASIATSPLGQTGQVRQIRGASSDSRIGSATQQTQPDTKPSLSLPSPGQVLPRGSLLNLSV